MTHMARAVPIKGIHPQGHQTMMVDLIWLF